MPAPAPGPAHEPRPGSAREPAASEDPQRRAGASPRPEQPSTRPARASSDPPGPGTDRPGTDRPSATDPPPGVAEHPRPVARPVPPARPQGAGPAGASAPRSARSEVAHASPSDVSARAGAPATSDPVRPVTRERLAESMRRREYRYLTDENGDVCGLWAYRLFSFYVVRGSILQVRGRWSRQAGIERLWEVLAFTDSWNATHAHPKVYVRVLDDGRVHVLTETSVTITSGLNDAQLDHQVAVGLAAGTAVFDALDHRYPDPVLTAGG